MHRPRNICVLLLTFFTVSLSFGQRSNDAIADQIKQLKADKITLTYDAAGDSSKVMAVAGNFDQKEASRAGIQAMNFGMAFFYGGKTLAASPETINLTFWVLTKKPQFAASHNWTTTVGGQNLDLGDARYAAKPGENMEYLNFKVKRDDLAKIGGASSVKIKLGAADLTFTPDQLTLIRNILAISDVH